LQAMAQKLTRDCFWERCEACWIRAMAAQPGNESVTDWQTARSNYFYTAMGFWPQQYAKVGSIFLEMMARPGPARSKTQKEADLQGW
jgi:hypothetical protein